MTKGKSRETLHGCTPDRNLTRLSPGEAVYFGLERRINVSVLNYSGMGKATLRQA
jgi:hypothetical protein